MDSNLYPLVGSEEFAGVSFYGDGEAGLLKIRRVGIRIGPTRCPRRNELYKDVELTPAALNGISCVTKRKIHFKKDSLSSRTIIS